MTNTKEYYQVKAEECLKRAQDTYASPAVRDRIIRQAEVYALLAISAEPEKIAHPLRKFNPDKITPNYEVAHLPPFVPFSCHCSDGVGCTPGHCINSPG